MEHTVNATHLFTDRHAKIYFTVLSHYRGCFYRFSPNYRNIFCTTIVPVGRTFSRFPGRLLVNLGICPTLIVSSRQLLYLSNVRFPDFRASHSLPSVFSQLSSNLLRDHCSFWLNELGISGPVTRYSQYSPNYRSIFYTTSVPFGRMYSRFSGQSIVTIGTWPTIVTSSIQLLIYPVIQTPSLGRSLVTIVVFNPVLYVMALVGNSRTPYGPAHENRHRIGVIKI